MQKINSINSIDRISVGLNICGDPDIKNVGPPRKLFYNLF